MGAGYLVLVARELTGLSQRRLARRAGTSHVLRPNPEDDLADFLVFREPSVFDGPKDDRI